MKAPAKVYRCEMLGEVANFRGLEMTEKEQNREDTQTDYNAVPIFILMSNVKGIVLASICVSSCFSVILSPLKCY